MQRFWRTFGIFLVIAGLFLPFYSVFAFGSFGGTLVSPPVPCFKMPGFFLVTIKPAGVFSPFYIMGPGSIFLGIPPYRPGQQILGRSDVSLICNGIPAFRITFAGTSI